ncbi:putative protein-tyrosine phosphatase [Sulfitobacter donghicola DSW-25 = KCTC 12864 = JCM 14565]|uniref:Tyrosine specific protein phosphatases domain-containing protein n=2 Tax=Sulfitobacter TaxID=60136 RepID=A0A073ILA4_9RHOB|nr:dual specificity protein phosphatase family protein [Sulfitobacter donghicola]KEJ91088.1 hypothetical protein DSW25_03090 [Sulfitobacter donghicola DSW-25 = KCTC 12864 = JCM 14565]KIN68180.1 putative protein-tyrosine phosphatase [Sulfitobacter donghicola DSW-25 = KCTC 12864 = JCM 14565]
MARPLAIHRDLQAIQRSGVNTVVSLLEPTEAENVGLAKQGETCAELGLAFINHPIRDMHLPQPNSFAALAGGLASRMRNGEHVAVHCFASIGRSGMLSCAILGHFGYGPDTAIEHVSKMRGVPVPDTTEQAAFIREILEKPTTAS